MSLTEKQKDVLAVLESLPSVGGVYSSSAPAFHRDGARACARLPAVAKWAVQGKVVGTDADRELAQLDWTEVVVLDGKVSFRRHHDRARAAGAGKVGPVDAFVVKGEPGRVPLRR